MGDGAAARVALRRTGAHSTAVALNVLEHIADDVAGILLRGYDRAVIPVCRRAQRRGRPPFGQSVFAVATRPVTASGR